VASSSIPALCRSAASRTLSSSCGLITPRAKSLRSRAGANPSKLIAKASSSAQASAGGGREILGEPIRGLGATADGLYRLLPEHCLRKPAELLIPRCCMSGSHGRRRKWGSKRRRSRKRIFAAEAGIQSRDSRVSRCTRRLINRGRCISACRISSVQRSHPRASRVRCVLRRCATVRERPARHRTGAKKLHLSGAFLMGPGGFEPPTNGL
jgi:hypothetical protein